MKSFSALLLAAILAALTSGCQHTGPKFDPRATVQAPPGVLMQSVQVTNQLGADLLRPPTNNFTLGPGDRLEIELLEDPSSRAITTVGPDGRLYFHLLPGLDVWGLTLAETKALIEKQLGNYIKDGTQVSVVLRGVESKRVWLLGRFAAPGVYSMTNTMTLLEAVAMAGGAANISTAKDLGTGYNPEDLADLKRSFVIRDGKVLPVDFYKLLREGDFSQNIYLQPDDFVYFAAKTAREVYVLGAVGAPRPIIYHENLTVAGAIAGALGTIKDSYLSHVAVVRGSLSNPQIAIVDYKAISQGRAPDVKLEANDIVYVPYSPYRYLAKYADIILTTFVSSVAINEGARAVVRVTPAPAGIFIPIGSGITVNSSAGGVVQH
ncbi:MAG TPA: polysaccharide biosynthesis/export family protein [Candidatus Saccharimonadales bacterium]|nr:polysaccharide biosynthesis/export family protein [Candidatus Saccharimonadales bacterium]